MRLKSTLTLSVVLWIAILKPRVWRHSRGHLVFLGVRTENLRTSLIYLCFFVSLTFMKLFLIARYSGKRPQCDSYMITTCTW